MKKRLVNFVAVIVGACFSNAVSAGEFRALDFGASCDNLVEREAALGSSAYDAKLPSGYQFAFRAREMDRDVVVGYSCRDGVFFRGAYLFDARDEHDATQLYTAVKRQVTRELGAPYYDFASAEHRRKMTEAGATLTRADTQVAFWKTSVSEAHASVAEPSTDRGWRVSLSYTALSALED